MKYEAFISYCQRNDRFLAKNLQRVIQTLGKPWYRIRTSRVFRDETSLSATPELWPAIVEALSNSEFLLLIASRDAAKSEWVSKEIEWWLTNKSASTLLIILSDGALQWNNSLKDFEASTSESLPPILFKTFHNEPLWIDLRDWRNATKNFSNDVQFKALASKIVARIKNIPPEDLWSEELTQQRRNLQVAGSAVAILSVLLIASLWLTYFSMQQKATALLSNMETIDRTGDYSKTLASAAPLKSKYFLSNSQIQKGEKILYDALWQNRLVKTIQLNDSHTLQFENGTEDVLDKQFKEGEGYPLTRLSQRLEESSDGIKDYIPPRHWQTPQGFANWSDDRRKIRIDLSSTPDTSSPSSMEVTLQECLTNGDDEYRIEKSSNDEELPRVISTRELLSNSKRAIDARNNLIAPIYHVEYGGGIRYLLLEIASRETLNDSWNQEILCILTIDPQDASIVEKYSPNLTLGLSMRIDNEYGLHRFSPGALSYLEMKNGGSLTISTPPNLSEKKTLLDDLSFLPYNNDIDQRVAFSKDGSLYIVSGYRREGSWEQPYVANIDQENRTRLNGHNSEVITVMISDSGQTAVTIDHELTARVWNLTDNPLGEWLDNSTTVIRPDWIPDFEIERNELEENGEGKHKELLKQLLGIESLKSIYAATEPQCNRTIVRFGGNDSSGVIGERDAESYIGLVDLNNNSIIYSISEADFSGEIFYFCSPEEAAIFAEYFTNKTQSTDVP